MAIKRVVDTSFWTDDKIVELFSPEDKYFMLYLLTNPHTTQLGIYPFVPKTAAFELGYSIESVLVLLDRFENKYGMIKFSKTNHEVAIKNYLVYSILKGGKPVEDLLIKEINQVKTKSFLKYVFDNLYQKDNLNKTVSNIVNTYIHNDNDNEESYHESCNESCNESLDITPVVKVKEPTFNEIINTYTKDTNLQLTISEFIKMRKTIKHALTPHALVMILNKLDKLAKENDMKIAILNQSIEHSWQGVFQLQDPYKQIKKKDDFFDKLDKVSNEFGD